MRSKKGLAVFHLGERIKRHIAASSNSRYSSKFGYIAGLCARIALMVSLCLLLVIFYASRTTVVWLYPAFVLVLAAPLPLLIVCADWRWARRFMSLALFPLYIAAIMIFLLQERPGLPSSEDIAWFGVVSIILLCLFYPFFYARQRMRAYQGAVRARERTKRPLVEDDDDDALLPSSLERHTSTKYSSLPGNIHN